MESFPKIIRKSQGLAIFIGFHSLENKVISDWIKTAQESQENSRGLNSLTKQFKDKGIKYLDFGTKPSKKEIEENKPSKSAELYSVYFGSSQL